MVSIGLFRSREDVQLLSGVDRLGCVRPGNCVLFKVHFANWLIESPRRMAVFYTFVCVLIFLWYFGIISLEWGSLVVNLKPIHWMICMYDVTFLWIWKLLQNQIISHSIQQFKMIVTQCHLSNTSMSMSVLLNPLDKWSLIVEQSQTKGHSLFTMERQILILSNEFSKQWECSLIRVES